MKKLTALAFLAALGLFALGCGEESAKGGSVVGSGNSAVDGGSNDGGSTPPVVGDDGYSTSTEYEDPASGEKTNKISDIVSDGTGATPPAAPTFTRAKTGEIPPPPDPLKDVKKNRS
ncbi:MAG: hypothetical protein LBO72_09960 [Helicobacteraceae bacterium]|jgi:hypothetical protein|nr:hypothetical protein [Helicobacteraceae bacterium]